MQGYLQRLNLFNKLRDNHIIVVFSLFPLLQDISYWGVLISHSYNQNLNSKHNEMFCLKKMVLYTSGTLRITRGPQALEKLYLTICEEVTYDFINCEVHLGILQLL